MSESGQAIPQESRSYEGSRGRGRGRGKSRGGLGKYLRARGRGRGLGRPAEFHKRLLLEGEGPPDEDDDEEAAEIVQKYSRRQLGTNADRYKEEEPELDSEGEPIIDPEVDLTSFLARQKLSDDAGLPGQKEVHEDDDDDIDHDLDHLTSGSQTKSDLAASRKGKAQEVKWDNKLDEMLREKETADAARALKSRFRAKSEKLKAKPVPISARDRRQDAAFVEAPALPDSKPKTQKEEMEDFLDDLLG